jgi:hypothetical protein
MPPAVEKNWGVIWDLGLSSRIFLHPGIPEASIAAAIKYILNVRFFGFIMNALTILEF